MAAEASKIDINAVMGLPEVQMAVKQAAVKAVETGSASTSTPQETAE